MSRHKLTIEAEYCADWTIRDALREILQNAIDTGTKVVITQVGTTFDIHDYGEGMELSDFLIGRTTKRGNNDTIGQFGEGAPIGCLVLARNNRKVAIRARGRKLNLFMGWDSEWNSELLTIDAEEDDTAKIGTSVQIECSPEEIEGAQNLFLYFYPKGILEAGNEADILSDKGLAYVNGLLVTTIESLFGYNFKNKFLVNRDRSIIGHSEIKNSIGNVLGKLTNKTLIAYLLQEAEENKSNFIEKEAYFYINNHDAWKKAIHSIWGKNVCIDDDPKASLRALEKNWVVLFNLGYSIAHALRDIIQHSSEVAEEKDKEYIAYSKLSLDERGRLRKSIKIATNLAILLEIRPHPVKVFEPTDKGFLVQTGCWDRNLQLAGISRERLQDSLSKRVATIVHEWTHGNTGHEDATRDFENDLTLIIGRLATIIFMEGEE